MLIPVLGMQLRDATGALPFLLLRRLSAEETVSLAIGGMTGLTSFPAACFDTRGHRDQLQILPLTMLFSGCIEQQLIQNRPSGVINRDLRWGLKADGHLVTSTSA